MGKRERDTGCRGFTIIELLVVVAVISVLASLLLPALSTAKFHGKNAACKNNLRQVGIALVLYVDSYGAYPRLNTRPETLGPTSYSWDQLLEEFIYPGRKVKPWTHNGTTGQVGPESRNRADKSLLCPVFLPKWPFDDYPYDHPQGPLYAYNDYGVGWDGHFEKPLLGLSGDIGVRQRFAVPLVISESMIVAPSEMIAIGDPFVRSLVPEEDGVERGYAAAWRPHRNKDGGPSPGYLERGLAAAKMHRHQFNRVFCDGHVEREDFRKPFVASDEYLRRWNNDNEPHRDLWK